MMGKNDRHAVGALPDARRRLRDRKGQAILEFALILPVFVLLLLGMIDFGVAYNDHNELTQLAGEAARYAAVDNCGAGCTSIVDQVKADAGNQGLVNGSASATGTGPDQPLRICFAYPNGTSNQGDPVQAIVETNYRWLPFLDLATVQLRATATMRIEQAPGGSVYTATAIGGNCPSYTPG